MPVKLYFKGKKSMPENYKSPEVQKLLQTPDKF
jgi:hypothetical protein